MSLLKRFGIVLLLSCLTACSLARFGYGHGEFITYWWLDGYVGFNSDQRPWVHQRIDAFFSWHRRTQLRAYVAFLAAGQHRLQHEVTKAEVLADYQELTGFGDQALDEASPALADLALSMDADNMESLQNKFASNNDDFRKHYLRGGPQERQEYRFKKVMEWAEYWFGDFSDEQQAVIRRASDQRPLNNEMWMTDRLQRQQALIALLTRIRHDKPARAEVVDLIKAYVSGNYLVRADSSPEMRAFFEASKDRVADMAVVIINIATAEQKKYATEKLQQWIDDFNTFDAKA